MTNWSYYGKQGKKITVTGGQLKWLAKNGTITPETLLETEAGKSVPARKVRGLTFIGATPPVGSMTEELGDQDFEQLREDFEHLQKQQDQQRVTQDIDTMASLPVNENPFVAPPPIPINPSVHRPTIDQTIPQSVLQPIAKGNKVLPRVAIASTVLWVIIASILFLWVVGGIGWAMMGKDRKFNDIVEKGLNKDVLADVPLELTNLVVNWTNKSSDKVSGKFSVKTKTTEALCQSVDHQSGLQKLGITNQYASECDVAMEKLRNLPVLYQNDLRDAMPQDPSRLQFYDILVPKGGEVTLSGSVDLTKRGNDWQVSRYLVDPWSCGDQFTRESKLPEGEAKLDDPKTKETVQATIQSRKDFITKVDSAVAEWEQRQQAAWKKMQDDCDKFCMPGMIYEGTYVSGKARGVVRVVFEDKPAAVGDSARGRGMITFSFAGVSVPRLFDVVIDTDTETAYPVTIGTIDNSRVPNTTTGFKRYGMPKESGQGAVDFYDLIQNFHQIAICFTNKMEFSVCNPNTRMTIPLNLSVVR